MLFYELRGDRVATMKPRCIVTLEHDMLEEVERFRYEYQFSTRSKAMVELIRLGLETAKKMEQEGKPFEKKKK